MTRFQTIEKRLFDIIVSFIGITVLFLPFLLLALLVKATSRGPIFFAQRRIGRHGIPFTCVKLRTMSVDSENQGTITTSSDSRIAPVGRVLRKFKLDELPQLWNVLLGKMSFVGPRPDVPGYADMLSGSDRAILELRPGITGPASLYFRNEEELLAGQADPKQYNDSVIWPTKVRINAEYRADWSFVRDIGYIRITILPVLDRVFRSLLEGPPGPYTRL